MSETVIQGHSPASLLDMPLLSAQLKVTPEDFQVDEVLGFEPDGVGQHWLFHIRKRGLNTMQAVEQIARGMGCSARDIGFCGLKDRHALTAQWLSVPVGDVDPADLPWTDELALISATPHGRKLRRGTHRGNRFTIRLRALEGHDPHWTERLERIRASGFPNYFAEQRFGQGGSNIERARQMGDPAVRRKWSRGDRNWGISALRALIFNQVLSERLAADRFDTACSGDVVMLSGTRSRFTVSSDEVDSVQQRLRSGDVVLTGPLWGAGAPPTSDQVAEEEQQVADAVLNELGREGWLDKLDRWRVEQDRRALMVRPEDLTAELDPQARTASIAFLLPRGSYATALLQELIAYHVPDPSR